MPHCPASSASVPAVFIQPSSNHGCGFFDPGIVPATMYLRAYWLSKIIQLGSAGTVLLRSSMIWQNDMYDCASLR